MGISDQLQTYIIIWIVGTIIFCIILSSIISGATKAKDNFKLQIAQVKLLALIAAKSGIPVEEINKVYKPVSYMTGELEILNSKV